MLHQINSFSLVVAGEMNPSIHQPYWYRLVGLMNEDEVNESTASDDTFCSRNLSQIAWSGYKIVCHRNRWQMQTSSGEDEDFQRVRSMAISVFDELLKHTTIVSIGLNFDLQRRTESPNVAETIGTKLLSPGLKLDNGGFSAGDIILQKREPDKVINLRIQPGDEPEFVQLNNNYHYNIAPEEENDELEFVQIQGTIEASFQRDANDAVERSNCIVSAINSIVKG